MGYHKEFPVGTAERLEGLLKEARGQRIFSPGSGCLFSRKVWLSRFANSRHDGLFGRDGPQCPQCVFCAMVLRYLIWCVRADVRRPI